MKGAISFLYSIKYMRDTAIIVEGKKDKEVLTYLGIMNVYTIYELKKCENIYIDYKKAIILTDNDKKGNKLYKYIRNLLESEGIIINDIYRKRFFNYFRVSEIENIRKYLEDLKFYINYFENPENILNS
ncbi:toprim domain protein [Nanobdella aerobiophila]|uniref:Toprim domain protein n=1 Tax=Nanobdella aerobiophila TaxID=2586965 RepID=A0A915SIP7_9ARCH|nr:hypothetical protein [Nanobdella aerobiophila]BBL45797.1 toprim domain protein [Nanobdella aerobiophila]